MGRHMKAKCGKGLHFLTPINVMIIYEKSSGKTKRRCRACHNARSAKWMKIRSERKRKAKERALKRSLSKTQSP